MTGHEDSRDFFISFNAADAAYAGALDAALRAAGFTTFYHPNDCPPGANIAAWMDDALMHSRQTLALYSPDYTKGSAFCSAAERYSSWWQDSGHDKRKLIPVLLRSTKFTPLMDGLKRIDVRGMTRDEAAEHVIASLRASTESHPRAVWRRGVPLPRIFNVAYRPNPHFTGRIEVLEALERSLRAGYPAITALAGMAGIGKTTLAAEYCHIFGGRYGGVWWIRADRRSLMLADLQALGQRLGIVATQKLAVDARLTLDRLATLAEPWLLVYDNAPTPDAIRSWLPRGAVRSLITSRYTEFGDLGTVMHVDAWPEHVGMNYLLSRTARDDAVGALQLARQLGGLPLAIEHAAAYLSPRVGLSFSDYAAEVTRLLKEEPPVEARGEYPRTVYATIVTSLETLGKISGAENALDVLRVCAFLSPDRIDVSLLTVNNASLPGRLASVIGDKFSRESAFAVLASHSLLYRRTDSPGASVVIHRLVQEVVRDWMDERDREVWGTAALQLVSDAFPLDSYDDPSQWPLCARLVPHLTPLQRHVVPESGAGQALGLLLNEAAVYLSARGDDDGALELAQRSVDLARQWESHNPLELAVRLSNLAGLHVDLGNLDDGASVYREAVKIKKALFQPSDDSLILTLSKLGEVHFKKGEFAEAERINLDAASIRKQEHGANSLEYAKILVNLSLIYEGWARASGNSEYDVKAERYARRGLAVTRQAVGPRHPATARAYGAIAALKASKGDGHAAARHCERSLAVLLSLGIWESILMRDYIQQLVTLWNDSGKPKKAMRLMHGDISDLLAAIVTIETEHSAWVAQDPTTRRFGPPSALAR